MRQLRYLLLQTRNPGDPMAAQEVRCFARALDCKTSAIVVHDLIGSAPPVDRLQQFDMLLLGGSGHYSVAVLAGEASDTGHTQKRSPWIERTLDVLRDIHRMGKPTFASCWGFQAMAVAMGGECVNDVPNAEVGTVELELTESGRADPIFGALPRSFAAQAGHEDHVIRLPPDAELLASSGRVKEQAFRFCGLPIYCTQFHPELDRSAMMERVVAYPEYIARIAKISFDEFVAGLRETPETNTLFSRFVSHFFGNAAG
jgi:GMP synthase (glutamine-hydrolysing)